AVSALKKCMRKDIARCLSKLSKDEIAHQTSFVLKTVEACKPLEAAHRVGIYISTDGEIITDGIIDLLFRQNKEIYIPNFKKGASDMQFVRLAQSEWIEGLPTTMWNIRQHSSFDDSQLLNTPLDLVFMPGVAFAAHSDGSFKRLGHGKGYFDRFLHNHSATYGRMPYLIGLALKEQIVDEVPLEEHDVPLNHLFYEF
ncbi:hypothetical protein PMAYCL1PPCAC_25299, partial [Pristionchus mayeri]